MMPGTRYARMVMIIVALVVVIGMIAAMAASPVVQR
jgi:hypothetical protein